MSLQNTLKLFLIALLIGLVAAGGLTAWASPPEAADEADEASAGTAGFNPGSVAASVAVPASSPRTPGPRIDIDALLIGTAVVEGGPSYALLQLTTGTRFVREGDEIVAGMRLVKVWRNRIDVDRAGVRQDIRQASNQEPLQGGETVPADVDRLWETQGRMGRSLFYSHYRRSQN